MDLKGYILSILLIGLIITTVGFIVSDFETQYPEVDVNTSSWSGKWNYADDLNESVTSIKEKFEVLGDPERGWFSKLAEGITAIPEAVILVAKSMFSATVKGVLIITEVGLLAGIPIEIYSIGIVALIIIIVFKLVEWWRRYKT